MARRINKRSELDSVEETVNNENIVEKESIEVELKVSDEESIINETISEEQKEKMMAEGAEAFAKEIDKKILEDLNSLSEEKVEISISEEDVEDLDEKFDVNAEEEIEKMFPEKKVEVKVLPKQPVNLLSLSRSQLRIFQRTGRLPN